MGGPACGSASSVRRRRSRTPPAPWPARPASTCARTVTGSPVRGYLTVFAVEAVLFVASAVLALRSASSERASTVMHQRGEMLPAVLQS